MNNQKSISKIFSLKGKHVLITGSTRGIGNAFAKAFLNAGCNVWIHGRNEDKCKQVAKDLNTPYWVAADMLNENAVEIISDKINQHTGKLDILINNAAIEKINPFNKFNLKKFDETFQVNVRAVIKLTYAMLPLLKASDSASVINITSIHQEIPYPHNMAYSMSKAAIGMFTKTLALELAPFGIRVNNFAPGAVKTEINREVIEENEDQFNEWIPLGRVAEVEDMTGSILYLASDASKYVTGTTLYADGGYSQNLVRYRPEE